MHKLSAAFLFLVLPLQSMAAVLPVSPQQAQRLGIRTAPVRSSAVRPAISVLGHVLPAPDARIPVSAPFAGTLKSLVRLEGEMVKKGDALAVIVSADMRASAARLEAQQAKERSARAAAERARMLVKEGIAPSSRAEEAEAEATSSAADLAGLRSAMARAAQAGSDGEYRLLAPAAGRVSAIQAEAGDTIAAMQPVMAIDTRDEMWVEADLPAARIGLVHAGDRVTVDGTQVSGVVAAAGTSIDPKTRSASLRARLTAAPGLVSGQTLRLSVATQAGDGSFTVPRNAISELKNGTAVFVQRANGFEAVSVRVLGVDAGSATVTGSLSARDRVAVTGVSELKAVSARE
jgi:cobalt-zinc-cadmium efflux system membrane fusion protein